MPPLSSKQAITIIAKSLPSVFHLGCGELRHVTEPFLGQLRYYDDYIRSERQKGRSEADIMEELGDPRLIARTILDTS